MIYRYFIKEIIKEVFFLSERKIVLLRRQAKFLNLLVLSVLMSLSLFTNVATKAAFAQAPPLPGAGETLRPADVGNILAPKKKKDKASMSDIYMEFMEQMKVQPTPKVIKQETPEAMTNPVWRFHSWLKEDTDGKEKTSNVESVTSPETFCYMCHNGKRVINYNFAGDKRQKSIEESFSVLSHHPVKESEKSTLYDPQHPDDRRKSEPPWEWKVKCPTCHNPGLVTGKSAEGGYPLTLPGEPDKLWTQKLIDGWPEYDNPPWPYNTPPKPLIYGQPYKDDPDPDADEDEVEKVLGPGAEDYSDYTTFCQTCHRQVSGRFGASNDYSRLKYDPIRFISGDGGGSIATHGLARGRETVSEYLYLREPFASRRQDEDGKVIANLYLACVDCHEPHGSENAWLIRTKVNGSPGVNVKYDGKLYSLCNKCHYIEDPWPGGYPHGRPGIMRNRVCIGCHNHSAGGGRF